jgi:hypothetical protein
MQWSSSHVQTVAGHNPTRSLAVAFGTLARDLLGCRYPRAEQEVGVPTEILLTKAEQVSDDGAGAAGLRPRQS